MLRKTIVLVAFATFAALASSVGATVLYDNITGSSPVTYGLMGGTGSTDNNTTTLWADDTHLAPSVANLGPTVTGMEIALADTTDVPVNGSWSPTMEITFWADNGGSGSLDGPGVWQQTVTITPTFTGAEDGSGLILPVTIPSADYQPGDFLYAVPSNFWVGVQFTSNVADNSNKLYANQMGMLAYGTVGTGSSNPGFFEATPNNNQGNFPPANNPSGSIVGAISSGDYSLGYQLTGIVPEPMTLGTLAAAGLLAATRRRRATSDA
jgi:hypothetical protein